MFAKISIAICRPVRLESGSKRFDILLTVRMHDNNNICSRLSCKLYFNLGGDTLTPII